MGIEPAEPVKYSSIKMPMLAAPPSPNAVCRP